MSAILGIYTGRSGFVIASDGRCTSSDDNSVISDHVQKIFRFEATGRQLGFAVMGAVGLTEDHTDKLVFDFISQISESAESLSNRKCRDLAGFVTRVCRPVNEVLKSVKARGQLSRYEGTPEESPEGGETIAHTVFQGYFDGTPAQVSARFFHRDQILQQPEIISHDGSVPFGYGSQKIQELIENEHPRFAKYKVKRSDSSDDLFRAVETARRYILACSDPEALHIDNMRCRAIGGHIQIATITPSAGFQWVSGHEPVDGPAGSSHLHRHRPSENR